MKLYDLVLPAIEEREVITHFPKRILHEYAAGVKARDSDFLNQPYEIVGSVLQPIGKPERRGEDLYFESFYVKLFDPTSSNLVEVKIPLGLLNNSSLELDIVKVLGKKVAVQEQTFFLNAYKRSVLSLDESIAMIGTSDIKGNLIMFNKF